MIESVIKCRTNGELIAATAPLWLEPTDALLDVTYGRGGFWTLISPKDWPRVEFDAAGLRHAYDVIHHSGTGPQPKHPRQVHPRAAHSFLCVFVKPNRRPRG